MLTRPVQFRLTYSPSKFVLALCLSASLACGATSGGGDPEVASAQSAMLKTRRTYIQGAVAGTMIGAGAGAGLGAIIGKQTGRAAPGAAIGAAGGAVVGLIGGLVCAQHVVHQRQLYASVGLYLEKCRGIASGHHAAAQHYLAVLHQREKVLARNHQSLKIATEGAHTVLARLKEEIGNQQQAVAQARSERVTESELRSERAEIDALRADERSLESEIERLSAADREGLTGQNVR